MKAATKQQKQAAEQRRAKFRNLARQLGAMPKAQRDALAARLPGIATVEGRTLSTINTCLIAAQCPSATIVGGFRQWKKAGRSVKKGEHGLSLWVPFGVKDADTGETDTRFGMGTVFDVAQTEEISAAPAVTASATVEVAAFIDPAGTLQSAGLLRVAA